MTALFESFSLTITLDIFPLSILTLLPLSRVRKPILDKRPNLSGDDRSSSSSDDEDSGDEVWAGMPKLTKGKGQSAYPKDDHNNNTARLHIGDPDPDQGSQGIDALDQVADITEFVTDIQAPADAGDSKEEKLTFLA